MWYTIYLLMGKKEREHDRQRSWSLEAELNVHLASDAVEHRKLPDHIVPWLVIQTHKDPPQIQARAFSSTSPDKSRSCRLGLLAVRTNNLPLSKGLGKSLSCSLNFSTAVFVKWGQPPSFTYYTMLH